MSYCVYLLRVSTPTKVVYKVGYSGNLSNRLKALAGIERPSSKVKGLGLSKPKLLPLTKINFKSKEEAIIYERAILKKYKQFKYRGPAILANGNSELLLLRPRL